MLFLPSHEFAGTIIHMLLLNINNFRSVFFNFTDSQSLQNKHTQLCQNQCDIIGPAQTYKHVYLTKISMTVTLPYFGCTYASS